MVGVVTALGFVLLRLMCLGFWRWVLITFDFVAVSLLCLVFDGLVWGLILVSGSVFLLWWIAITLDGWFWLRLCRLGWFRVGVLAACVRCGLCFIVCLMGLLAVVFGGLGCLRTDLVPSSCFRVVFFVCGT